MKEWIEIVGRGMELAGVLTIVLGAIWSLYNAYQCRLLNKLYESFRMNLGRSILLGLELLVAGDIINTVAVDPTMESVTLLGVIVLIRTFLSFSLSIELEGTLPWKKKQ
ncbi:MAG: DUF1622 domain-containing protein [Bdellovibrionota bacterium]